MPTPRECTYDALRQGIKAMQAGSVQERAMTSAIWYLPE